MKNSTKTAQIGFMLDLAIMFVANMNFYFKIVRK